MATNPSCGEEVLPPAGTNSQVGRSSKEEDAPNKGDAQLNHGNEAGQGAWELQAKSGWVFFFFLGWAGKRKKIKQKGRPTLPSAK